MHAQRSSPALKEEAPVRRLCPVCNSTNARPKWTKASLAVQQCANCSMLFVRDVPKEFATAEFYKGSSYHLVPDKLESDYAAVRFERELRVFRRFCESGSVLDVGCSTGGFLHQLTTRWPEQYDVAGIDVAVAALEYACLKGVPVICDSLLTHDFGAKKFAAITFWAVMEHLV